MKELSSEQQTKVRMALGMEIASWKKLRSQTPGEWPYADAHIGELETVLDLFRRNDIFIGHADELERECERCGYRDCVCGDPQFETHNTQELNRAAEVD